MRGVCAPSRSRAHSRPSAATRSRTPLALGASSDGETARRLWYRRGLQYRRRTSGSRAESAPRFVSYPAARVVADVALHAGGVRFDRVLVRNPDFWTARSICTGIATSTRRRQPRSSLTEKQLATRPPITVPAIYVDPRRRSDVPLRRRSPPPTARSCSKIVDKRIEKGAGHFVPHESPCPFRVGTMD